MHLAEDLRAAIYQAAIQGKISEQLDSDGSAEELLNTIRTEKVKLLEQKEVKKENEMEFATREDVDFEFPENWTCARMGHIFEIIRGSSPRPKGSPEYWTTEQKDYHWITISDITSYSQNGVLSETKEYLTKKGKDKSTYVGEGELIIAVSGSTTGKCCLLGVEGYIYDGLAAIIDCTNRFNKRFLYVFMKYFYNKLNAAKKGTSFPNINTDLLKESIIVIPPLEEQQRIVNKIDELMLEVDKYKKYEEQLAKLEADFPEDLKSSLLQEAMQGKLTEQLATDSSVDSIVQYIKMSFSKKVKGIENDTNFVFPDNWKCLKLMDAVSIYTGNSISESVKEAKYTGLVEGYDYIGTKDIEFDHTITYNNGVRIPLDEPKFKYAEKDATLLCIEGGSAGRKIALLDRRVCFGNKLCAFHPIGINKKFLYYYLQSPVFLNLFMDKITGIIGGVSINKIKQVIIPIPPIEEQQRIVEKLEILLPVCDDLKED